MTFPRLPLERSRRTAGALIVALLGALCTSQATALAPSADPAPAPAAAPAAAPASTGLPAKADAAARSVKVVDMVWTDSVRQRELPVRLYWPEGASKEHPVPLVVFSHGLGGSRMGYSYLGRYWASLGFASLHVQHPGSDRAIWGGNIFTMIGNMQSAASESNAMDRARDVSFAITAALGSADYGALIDPAAIAVAGHSYGANTALLVGGATVERNGKPVSFRDERVKALVLISAPPFTGEGDMGPILNPIRVPTLHVTGTDDIIRVPGYYSDVNDRIAVYDAVRGPDKLLTVFKGATHSIFTDRGATELSQRIKGATKELSGLFLKAVLAGARGNSIDEWMQAQQGLLARSTGGLALKRSPS